MLWDDIRKTLRDAEKGVFTRDDYWNLVHLINDYGFAMQVAGIRGEVHSEARERVFSNIMGATPGVDAREDREKYNYGG